MFGDVVGYAFIDRDAKTGTSPAPIKDFVNQSIRVIEFAKNGGVMVVHQNGQDIATFNECDVKAKFECSIEDGVICDPKLNAIEKMAYAFKARGRKGGYGQIVKYLVIQSSLHRGQFCDSVLWAKQ